MDAQKVRRKQPLEIFKRCYSAAVSERHPGIENDPIDTIVCQHFADLAHPPEIGHIGFDRLNLHSCSAALFRNRFEPIGATGDEYQRMPLFRIMERQGFPQSAAGSRNHYPHRYSRKVIVDIIIPMNETLHMGEINTLVIDRSTVPGLFLKALDGNDVLLPNQYVTDAMHVGDTIDVFVYTDSEDRPVATTLSPKAMLGEIAFLEVVDTTPIGAFVDWGLMKDLFVPKALQKRPFSVGEKRLVRVIRDEQTGRLVGTEKITGGLEAPPRDFYPNTPVTFMIIAKTPLGYKAIVDHRFEGMIYANEIFEEVRIGQIKEGYVKQLRPDGKLDLSLQMTGKAKASGAADKVYAMLQANGGMLPYNSKTDPELIQKTFGLSKKNFKAALTQLVGDQKIIVKENGIYGI